LLAQQVVKNPGALAAGPIDAVVIALVAVVPPITPETFGPFDAD
jgi:hypothetical protein